MRLDGRGQGFSTTVARVRHNYYFGAAAGVLWRLHYVPQPVLHYPARGPIQVRSARRDLAPHRFYKSGYRGARAVGRRADAGCDRGHGPGHDSSRRAARPRQARGRNRRGDTGDGRTRRPRL